MFKKKVVHEKLVNTSAKIQNPLSAAISQLEKKIQGLSEHSGKSSAEISSVLHDLTKEFDDLSMEMCMLRGSLDDPDNHPKKISKSSKSTWTDQDQVVDVFQAKDTISECLIQLITLNNFIDSTVEKSTIIRKAFTGGSTEFNDVLIHGLSIGSMSFIPEIGRNCGHKNNQTSFRKLLGKNSSIRSSSSRQQKRDSEKWYSCCFRGSESMDRSQNNPIKKRSFMMTHSRRLTPSLASLDPPNSHLKSKAKENQNHGADKI